MALLWTSIRRSPAALNMQSMPVERLGLALARTVRPAHTLERQLDALGLGRTVETGGAMQPRDARHVPRDRRGALLGRLGVDEGDQGIGGEAGRG